MGEYGFDRGNDAGIDATAQMPGADGYPGYSPGHGEGNPAPAKTMVTRRHRHPLLDVRVRRQRGIRGELEGERR